MGKDTNIYLEYLSNQPVVIDNGSGTMKAGFAGTDRPSLVFPSFIGRPKHTRVMAGGVEGDIFLGNRADELRGLLWLRYPMTHGIVEDWNDMEAIWTHVYNELKVKADEHPALLTEAPLNPLANRERQAEIFFETFGCPALFISVQAVLSLYATGRTTGVVLDSGDGVSHAVPVYEGFSLTHAITRSDVAGRDVTHYLANQLRRAGYIFHTSAEIEVIKDVKEQTCYVAFNPQKEGLQDHSKAGGSNPPFKLPDGTDLQLGAERYRAPEVLFNPTLIGTEYAGVHELLVTSIARTDLDIRKAMYSQMILSGGSTLFPGYGDRLLNEVRKLAPKDIKIRISAPPDRKISTWVGGSILASLATFKKMWITKQEHEEEGSALVHRRTL